jgi:hypothetical protein
MYCAFVHVSVQIADIVLRHDEYVPDSSTIPIYGYAESLECM